jgi:mRNA-degrading endonuclease RelE of RelBE toxin-antitoxin system
VASYRVEVKRKAYKELMHVQPDIGREILISIEALGTNPRPRQSHKLAESESSYRLRVRDYRVNYRVDDEACGLCSFVSCSIVVFASCGFSADFCTIGIVSE